MSATRPPSPGRCAAPARSSPPCTASPGPAASPRHQWTGRGNAHLIEAAAGTGAAFVLVSVAGASPGHPIGLFRAKHAAEEMLQASGIPWTIVRATAFMETWGAIMGEPALVREDPGIRERGNPVNFVSATDVAALVSHAASSSGLDGRILELGGPGNLTFNEVAAIVQQATGCRGTVRHIPHLALHMTHGYRRGQKPRSPARPAPRSPWTAST